MDDPFGPSIVIFLALLLAVIVRMAEAAVPFIDEGETQKKADAGDAKARRALKLALKQPDKFAGAVGISSVADIKDWFTNVRATPEMTNIFGSNEIIDREGNDLFALAESAKNAANPPKIMTICGTEDFLYQNNQNLRNHFLKIGYPGYEYHEGPGIHTWSFWDQWIQVALKFLLEK